MVQAEVADRLAARPGSKVYGVPSVKAAWYADVRRAGAIGRNVFWPAPNVDSGLVAWTRREPPATTATREQVFAVVDAAFAQRRKTLRAALRELAGSADAAEAALAPPASTRLARGEALGVDGLRPDRRGAAPRWLSRARCPGSPSAPRRRSTSHLGVGAVARRRLPPAGDRLPGRRRCTTRSPRRRPRTGRSPCAGGRRRRRPACPLDDTNLALRAARLLADAPRASTEPVDAAHRQEDPGRRRPGRRLGRRRRRAGRAATGSGASDCRRRRAARAGRRARQRRAVRRCVGGTALGTGRGELVDAGAGRAAPGDWVVAARPPAGLSTPAVYAEFDRLHAGRAGRRRRSPRRRCSPRCAPATSTALGRGARTTTCSRPRCDLRPELARACSQAGLRRSARWRRSSPAPGPTCLFLCADADHARAGRRRAPAAYGRGAGRATARSPAPRSWPMRAPDGATWSTSSASPRRTASGRCSTDVTLGVSARASGSASSAATATARPRCCEVMAGLEEPDAGRVSQTARAADRLPPPGRRARRHRTPSARRCSAARPTTSGPPTRGTREVVEVLLAGVALDRAVDRAVRWRAPALLAGRAAARRARPDRARRAHQPPRRRGGRLAGRPPAPRAVGAGRGHPRPLVPRRGLPDGRGRCTTASSTPTRAATPRSCSPRPSGSARPPPRRPGGRTWSARSWPGCAAVRRPARPSRSSASTPPTR